MDSKIRNKEDAPKETPSNSSGPSPESDSGVDVHFFDNGSYDGEDRGFFSHLSPATLGIVCACAVAAVLIVVAAVVWLRARRRRQKLLHDLTFDELAEDFKSTKSAPASRSASPKLNKRMSCPDALSSVTTGARGVLVRSMTADRIPDFTLPPERVQPWGSQDKKGSGINSQQRNNSIGSITPNLYHHQSFSEDDEPNLPETPYGRLWFSLIYDAAVEHLDVNLVKVKDLPARSNSQQPRDPFVKIFLLPDDKTHRVSKVKKRTLSPVFNETHTFQVTAEDVKKRVLRFSVYDVDKRRVRHSLGHIMIHLKNVDLTKGDVMWSDLEPTVQTAASLGEIQFSLVYIPSSEKIKIAIHRAKNLNYLEDYPDMDVYVRVQLFYGHKCHRIKRTIARQGGHDMNFNESLSFTVAVKQMDSCNMMVSLMLTSPRVYASTEVEYGRVVIGPFMYARGDELLHWQEMLSQSKLVTTHWHCLTNMANSP